MSREHCTLISPHSPLAAVAVWMRQHQVWERIAERVHIAQKKRSHAPIDKLLMVLMTILCGAKGLVEANTRVKSDRALHKAFGLQAFADQSLLSETLNACSAENVTALRHVLTDLYRRQGGAWRQLRDTGRLILDVDLTGMPCGKQAEGATKGYFSEAPGRRGRQLGRVVAPAYEEIVVQELYPGRRQLGAAFRPLVAALERVLDREQESLPGKGILLRSDAGAGTEEQINWALQRGYAVLTKIKNYQRTRKLLRSAKDWFADPKVPSKSVAWVTQPHPFAHPTLQIAVRSPRQDDGQEQYTERVLVTSLSPVEVVALMGWTVKCPLSAEQVALAVVYLYDQRGGGAETQNRQDKQGLGLTKRNKNSFIAQQMLILLAELAHNLLIWVRRQWAQVEPFWQHWGLLRLIRDAFHILGQVTFDANGQVCGLALHLDHPLSRRLLKPLHASVGSQCAVILHEI